MGLFSPVQKTGLFTKAPVSQDAMDFFAPSLSAGPSFKTADSTTPVPTPESKAAGSFLPSIGQGIARGYIATGQGIVNTVTGNQVPFTPSGKIQTALFGTEKPISLQSVGEEYPFVPKGSPVAPVIAGFGQILDLVGGGGGRGIATALRDARTVEEAAKVMRTAGFAEDAISKFAPRFAKEGTLSGTKALTEEAQQFHNAGVAASKEAAVTADASRVASGSVKTDKVQAALHDWEKNYAEDVNELSNKISDTSNKLKTANKADRAAIEEQLASLHSEAAVLENKYLAKWGDAELYFHGADSATADLIKTGGFKGSEDFPGSGMVSLTKDANEAANYAHLTDKPGEILPVAVKQTRTKEYSSLQEYTDAIEKAPGKTAAEKEASLNSKFDLVRVKVEGQPDIVFANPKSVQIAHPDLNTIATPTRETPVPDVQGEAAARPSEQILPEQTRVPEALDTNIPLPSESLDSAKQLSGEVSRPFKQVVGIGQKNTTQPNLYRRVVKTIDKAFTNVAEYVAESDVRVRKLLENPELTHTDATNPYQKMTLYPGRVATRVEEARAQMEAIASDMSGIAHDTGRDTSLVREDVNSYLQATHAPERNAVLGDGAAGMTDAEAARVREVIDSNPGAEEIKRIAEQVRELNQKGLGLLRDSGVISPELHATLTKRYPNHVPLQRVFENEPDVAGALSARGFDVKSSGIKSAKGSEREVMDIVGNVQHNYEQAVIRSEKNIVDQATLGFVRENRDALSGLMEVRKPRAVGTTFDDKVIMERTTDPSYIQLFEKGKPIWIKVTDPALALAFRGVNREKLPALLNTVGAFTRFYAGLATRFNPEFALPNKLRDMQETMTYLAAQKDTGFKGAAQVIARDPSSIKAVFDSVRGADTPGARIYKEMQEMGGTTGGFGLSTRKQVELDFEDMLANAQSRPREYAGNVVKYIDYWNTIFEDSTRLSVYKQALSQGASKERAAFLAKEASINFNRMGRGGPVINAIWMFSNASIQGSVKMVRALKNPKVLAAVTATIGASVGAVNEWNDRVDPDWRNKVTKWDRLNGLPIILPNEKGEGVHYVTIPVSWGLKPIKVMADYSYDMATGKDVDGQKAVSDFFTSMIDAYNPLGGTDLVSALTPTILDVPIEVVRNQSWSGSKIHPDFDKNAPRDVQYFSSLGDTATGKAFIEGTKALQEKTGIALSPADMVYAFEQYIGGAGKAVEKTANAVFGLATGKPVQADEYPFISRFYRTRTQEEVGQGAGAETDQLKSILQNQSRETFYAKQAVEDEYTKLKGLPKAEQDAEWKQTVKDNPDMARKIMQLVKDDSKGLSYTERLIGQLTVKDGQRALYIKNKLDALKTPEDKGALWKDYVQKGLITSQVADQIDYLLKQGKGGQKQTNAGGGISDILATVTGAKTAEAAEKPASTDYFIRDNKISSSDLEEAKAVLFGEVSNRTPGKQQLEAQTILNTAFNRMDEYRKRGVNKTLTQVLQEQNQYQAYKGKEYNRYKKGALRETDSQKTQAIDTILEKVKDGSFQNNIGDSVFYIHHPDGRIAVNNKKLFAS